MERFKSSFPSILLLIITIFISQQVDTSSIRGKSNIFNRKTGPTILNRSQFVLSNPYASRQTRSLFKFSIKGAYIENIESFSNGSLERYELTDGTVVELYTFPLNDHLKEYNLIWYGGGPNPFNRELCFHYSQPSGTYWYGTYHSVTPEFPLNPAITQEKIPFNFLNPKNQQTVKSAYSDVLEHLFLNTAGFAILPNSRQPLYLRRDPNNGDALLCFSVNNTWPYNGANVDARYLDIQIHMFAGSDMTSVLNYVIHDSKLLPNPTEIPDKSMFHYPSWVSWNQPAEAMKYPQILQTHGFTKGEILLNEQYAPNMSPLPEFDLLIDEIHSRGFTAKFVKSPSLFRVSKTTESYFLREASTGKKSDWIDFSNSKTTEWYRALYRKLQLDDGVDSFVLMATEESAPVLMNNSAYADQPNDRNLVHLQSLVPLSGSNSLYNSFKNQHLPAFTQLTSSSYRFEEYLESFLAGVLSVSIGGYSWISPKPVGIPNAPSEEMYLRWIQALTFMPHMAFYTHPWQYSQFCTSVTKRFLDLHETYAETFIKLAMKRVETGAPIIRPLWYKEPLNSNTYTIKDQFMVGESIVVAPILKAGVRERKVFLPTGRWIDQRGIKYVGAGTFMVQAGIEELPYFVRA